MEGNNIENKKRFTLVGLLVVIAILAILVIIAMPSVLKLFNNPKKDTFLTEVKTIFDETKKKYISESKKGNTITTISSKDASKLDINGSDLDYCVILGEEGKVEKIAVGNKSFYVILNNVVDINSLKKEDIKDGQLQDMECNPGAFKVKLNCEFDGKLKQGAKYVNGQYTYRYKQEGVYSADELKWENISADGWGVQLTDRESTEPVTSELCSSINGKPIVSMSTMFFWSEAAILDLSNFDTSSVTNMSWMFTSSQATEIKGLEKFDTTNVTNMSYMFEGLKDTTLDLNSFNTSKVTNMSNMFDGSRATTLDLSSFDTSKVTNMKSMFYKSQATTIKGLENFNTTKVTNMMYMFGGSKAKSLDLSSFNTSHVILMSSMFEDSQATSLDLSSFDTSNVTDMSYMFGNSKATTGYAKTQADADKLNLSSGKPSVLTFVVKEE
ncbi:MAG: BspA family leucine-rich repeat surface protein [Bacilli bacterium]